MALTVNPYSVYHLKGVLLMFVRVGALGFKERRRDLGRNVHHLGRLIERNRRSLFCHVRLDLLPLASNATRAKIDLKLCILLYWTVPAGCNSLTCERFYVW